MHFIPTVVIAGLIGTTGMTIVLWTVDRTGRVNANMVRALGSALTRSVDTSLLPGLAIQYISGVIFAFFYIYFLQMLKLSDALSFAIAGGVIGFAHGFAFSFIMVILAEHHPIEKFQNAGFQVAITHFFAHIVYGGLVGLVAGLLLL
jgi:hypothetical protein